MRYQKKSVDRREARGAETRRNITAAVWQVMAADGLAALTVRRVGEVADISHAMVHYHFDDKSALIRSVVPYARHYWISPLEELLVTDLDPVYKLDRVISWMAEPATREVMRVHRQLLSQSEFDDELRQAMAGEYRVWRGLYIRLFEDLRRAGALVDNVDVEILGSGFSELADHLVGKQALDPAIDAEAIMRQMIRPFLADVAAQEVVSEASPVGASRGAL